MYASGWEAYTINLPLLYDISEDVEPFISVNAEWHNKVISPASIDVSITLFSAESVILQEYSSPITVSSVIDPFASDRCSNVPKVAFSLSPKSSLPSPTFSLEETSMIPFPVPEPSFEPSFEPSTEPEPSFGPIEGVTARITFSWTSTETDVEAAIEFAGSKVGANCALRSSPYVSYSGNNVNEIGSESFRVLVQTAREAGEWQNRTVIPLFADWWSRRPSSSSQARVAVKLEAEDGSNLFSRSVRIFPDVGTDCPSYQAAKLILEYDASSDSYSASLRVLPPPTIEPSEEPSFSEEPNLSPEPSPFPKRTRKGVKLQIIYNWNRAFTGLHTAVRFPDYEDEFLEFIGGRCHSYNRYVYRSRNMKMKTMKEYYVSVEAAREEGVWNSSVDIPLMADWRGFYPNGGGIATVTAALMDEDGALLSPSSTVTVIPGVDLFCPQRKVGTVRIKYKEKSDEYNMKLMSDPLAAPPSFFTPSPIRPRDETVVFIRGNLYPPDLSSISDNSLISVEFSGVRVGGNCNTGISPYILYSYYTTGFSIRYAIVVRIEKALTDGIWNDSTEISIYGPRMSAGFIDLSMYSEVISARERSSFDYSFIYTPNANDTGECPTIPRATLTVSHDGGRNFRASFDDLNPSPTPDEPEEPTPSPEFTFSPPPEEGMLIEYSWPENERDLDSAVALFDERDGTGCSSSSELVSFFGDDTSFGGTERFWISLPKALKRGLWSSFVDVTLIAKWYSREAYSGGTVTVTVSYIGKDLEVQESVSETFNPVLRQKGIGSTGCSNKIGRVRVVRNTDGDVSFFLEHY